LAVIDQSTQNSMLDLPGYLPLHQMFTDKNGDSIVIEALTNGELHVYEQTTDTIANSPTYDWHITNLRNYVNLSDYTKPQLQLGEFTIKDIESGSGLHGLPGDYTSPSRYLKITLLSKMMKQPHQEQALNELYTVFCSVIIPEGVEKDSPTQSDYTAYWSGYDLSQCELRVKPTKSNTFTKVTLQQLQERFGNQIATVPINLTTNLYHEI
uniref:linear amide C-N hydrolase n=1 Tax=uncultured Enterococcus sp. TaxID=167972 RepID=UPI0025F86D9A